MDALFAALKRTRRGGAGEDDTLLRRARARDETAIRALVQRHNQRLFRLARGLAQDDAEAEDIVQETYVRALSGLDRFRGESALSTWLCRIALNEAKGRLRRRRPSVPLEDAEGGPAPGKPGGEILRFPMTPPPDSPESETGRAQVRRILEDAIDTLPPEFRVVFILRCVEGLRTAEAAELLDLKPATVKTRLFRAKQLMRSEVEKTLSAGFADLYPFAGRRCAAMADRVVARLREDCGGAS